MRTILSLPARSALSVAAALVLAACNGGDNPTVASGDGAASASKGAVAASPVPGIDAERNDADIAFIRGMTPHHASALEMAGLAASRADSAQVKDLAGQIMAAQDPELETMRQMAAAWGVDLQATGQPMSGMSGGMSGMSGGMGDDVTTLEPLSGRAFDKEFLTLMTAHHSSAIAMAEKELVDGQNVQAKELATAIITAQKAEIAEMKSLLSTL